jgi:hypothetical protein
MNDSIIVAIITASCSIFVAALTFYLTKRHQLKVEWQHEKLNHYKVLLASLSGLADDGSDKTEANMRFALAVNTIGLVASQDVIAALMAFHGEIKISNPNKSDKRHDELLNQFLLAVRKDIGFATKDDPATFYFHFVTGGPPKGPDKTLHSDAAVPRR